MDRMTINSDKDETASVMTGSSTHSVFQSTRGTARGLALGAVSGPVLFTLAWLILGFVSPGYVLWDIPIEPYSPISQPISGLGLGLTAPFMNAAFIIGGIRIIAGAVGIFQSISEMGASASWSCTVLLAITGLGMINSGIFTLEEILPHTIGFIVGIGTPILSFLVIGLLLRRIPRWRQFGSWLLAGSPLTLVLMVLFFATNDPIAAGAGFGVAGLTQRILVSEVLDWIVIMGWKSFRFS